jgi:hypothetical protein
MPGARWALVNGSSFAAAHVSGLVALLVELRPALTPAALRSRLSEAGAGVAAFSLNTRQEAGQQAERTGSIDACAVIGRAAGACVCPCPSTVAITAEKAP